MLVSAIAAVCIAVSSIGFWLKERSGLAQEPFAVLTVY
jgi:hypothetical protein